MTECFDSALTRQTTNSLIDKARRDAATMGSGYLRFNQDGTADLLDLNGYLLAERRKGWAMALEAAASHVGDYGIPGQYLKQQLQAAIRDLRFPEDAP
jgi:hypothetical protein